MESQPLVSVLMTAYNREQYISASIESVLSSILKDFELIIVDDCSTDSTLEIAKSYAKKDDRIKIYRNEANLGDYKNRNKAASYATGKYIKYLDSDDIMYEHCLFVMVNTMEKFPQAGYGLASIPNPYIPLPVFLTPREAYLEHFHGYGHFDRSPASAIIRRDVFMSVGGFSGARWIGDTELWFTISKKWPLVKFQREMVWDRMHPDQERKIEASKENKKLSSKMRKDFLSKALSDDDCPLTKDDVAQVYRTLKRHKYKDLAFNVAKWLMKPVSKLNN